MDETIGGLLLLAATIFVCRHMSRRAKDPEVIAMDRRLAEQADKGRMLIEAGYSPTFEQYAAMRAQRALC